ncbi:MAG: ribosome maturation factor RimM [Proteobacteria bacterium]|nr:ribosome maturation factor RimM [Pseudomonadota bacterium]
MNEPQHSRPSPHAGGDRRPILIGRILGAHGVRGEVKLKSFAANPADIGRYAALQLADGRTIRFARLKPARDEFIASVQGVSDRNAAESFRGQDIFVDRTLLPPTKDGEFYLSDLIGREVRDATAALGTVSGIQNFGAGDLIELESGLLIPVAFVDSATDFIAVTLPEGFTAEATAGDREAD